MKSENITAADIVRIKKTFHRVTGGNRIHIFITK